MAKDLEKAFLQVAQQVLSLLLAGAVYAFKKHRT